MLPSILCVLLTASPGADDSVSNAVKFLIDTIESLQAPVEDFRCEFEGTMRFTGKGAEDAKPGEELLQEFSGVFVWKQGGDVYSDSLHRRSHDGAIGRDTLVVRMREGQAQQYQRLNDASLGSASVQDAKNINYWRAGSLGEIFLIDRIKRDTADENLEASVHDDQIEGRPLKVLNIALKGVPDSLLTRYWIDLRRNGNVVRVENYQLGKVMIRRLDIQLASFRIGNAEVWMPVSGQSVGYAAVEDKKPVVTKEPSSFTKIYVVGGTMEFNKHPGPEVFTIKYKPGTPISDDLRKLQYEFGQQKIGSRPTKAETETMLHEAVAEAEKQKKELIAAPTEGIDWVPWLPWVFGAAVVVSLVALTVQRRVR